MERVERADEQEIDESGEPPAPPEPVKVPYFTYIMTACIVAIAGIQLIKDPPPIEELGFIKNSIWAAGFVKPFFRDGEYWRILTGAVIHANVVHIAFNAMALFNFGRIVEQLSSRYHLVIVFILSALGGNFVSLLFKPDDISVGASGGIIGLLGYLVVYSMVRKQFVAREFRRDLLFNTGFIVVYGLALYETIDNSAHAGGFLTGAIYALLQVPRDPYADPREAGTIAKVAGFAALGIFLLTAIITVLLIFGFNEGA